MKQRRLPDSLRPVKPPETQREASSCPLYSPVRAFTTSPALWRTYMDVAAGAGVGSGGGSNSGDTCEHGL